MDIESCIFLTIAIYIRHEPVQCLLKIIQCISYYRRFIANSTLFQELVRLAEKASSAKYTIGGNAPIMANRFVKEGCSVLLGAQMSRALQSKFPDEIQISGPFVERDDIHLLLEYPTGQRWGNFVPPRANR